MHIRRYVRMYVCMRYIPGHSSWYLLLHCELKGDTWHFTPTAQLFRVQCAHDTVWSGGGWHKVAQKSSHWLNDHITFHWIHQWAQCNSILVTCISLLWPTHQVPFLACLTFTHYSHLCKTFPSSVCLFSHLPASLHVTLSLFPPPLPPLLYPPSHFFLPFFLPLSLQLVLSAVRRAVDVVHILVSHFNNEEKALVSLQTKQQVTQRHRTDAQCRKLWNYTYVATFTMVIVCMLSVHRPLNEQPLLGFCGVMLCQCDVFACLMKPVLCKAMQWTVRSDSVLVLQRKYQSGCYQSYLTGCTIFYQRHSTLSTVASALHMCNMYVCVAHLPMYSLSQ